MTKLLKAYLENFYKDYYYFCQKYENNFKISKVTKMNHTLFATLFFHSIISLR